MTGAVAGGLLTAGIAPAEAATRTILLPARRLKPGDLIVGPRSTVVRVASRRRLANGRQRIRYTHPSTGRATPFDAASDRQGYASGRKFAVLLRGAGVETVLLTAATPQVIDGGTP
ncbi:MAG: hypothetical protein Q8O61_13495 [Nocardioides sp.]|nr:hypothetical protein [Nocardioides sp.]